MEEGDPLVLRVIIGVSFAFLPLLNKSTRGSFCSFIIFCSFVLVFFHCFSLMFVNHEIQLLRDCLADEEPLMAYGCLLYTSPSPRDS